MKIAEFRRPHGIVRSISRKEWQEEVLSTDEEWKKVQNKGWRMTGEEAAARLIGLDPADSASATDDLLKHSESYSGF